MKVAMLISRFPPCVGGTERQAFLVSRELVKLGVDVTVITQRYDTALPAEETLDRVKVRRLEPAGASLWAAYLFTRNAFRYLEQMNPRPDILHAHMIASPAVLAVRAGNKLAIPSIVKVACAGPYGDVGTSRQTWYGRVKLKRVLKGADRLVCLTGESEKEIQDAGAAPARIARIPNGVDTEYFHPAISVEEMKSLRAALKLPAGRLILFSGRLTPQKRPQVLLDAFIRRVAGLADATLVFLGDGPLRDDLKRQSEAVHLAERVVLRGNQTDIKSYYRCADLFVLPSAAEGLSNSLLEAMACGLPCVVSDQGGQDVIQNNVNGLTVPPDAPDALARAMETLLTQPATARKLGEEARKTTVEKFRITAVARRYADLYEELRQ